ncbi:hypothetical protein NEOLEDRAFT_1215752 [Neolentinus lepideus HHB14362 ss-1]|uniref:Uncharacterized protein n=1 Tax=Neolentinus lepideus HHB14362 ss-1 TaxID=1314782 RepID=A0A165VEV9_9AGAM|nr:hypothetical protein NEOLEDRAFT_1215752 [Neolentinus lepideus HHB14362 ss-1]
MYDSLAALLGALFVGTTADFIIDTYVTKRFHVSPTFYDDTPHALQEQNAETLLYCIHDGIFGVEVFLADALLVWRYYVFWDRRIKPATFPLLLIMVEIVLWVIVIANQARRYLIRKETPWGQPLPNEWYQVSSALNMLNRAYYTATSTSCPNVLAAWKIWHILREMRLGNTIQPSKHHRVLHIMLESGVIYSILILMALVVSSIPYDNLFANAVDYRISSPYGVPLSAKWYKVDKTLDTLNRAYYLSTCAINLVLSIAITWRIWRAVKSIRTASDVRPTSRYYRIAHIMLESGIIHSVLILGAIGVGTLPNSSLLGVQNLHSLRTSSIYFLTMPSVWCQLQNAEYTSTILDSTALETEMHFASAPRADESLLPDRGPPVINISIDIAGLDAMDYLEDAKDSRPELNK